MKKIKNIPTVIIVDSLVFIFAFFALISIFCDFRFMGDYPRMANIPYLMTYTGLSNLFIGIVSLLCALYRIIFKKELLIKWFFILKIVALVQITITFLITAIYLSPHLGSNWWRLYINASLFNHFLTPVLAIISFLFFEYKVDIKIRECLYSLIFVCIYAIMYIINVYTHLNSDGSTSLDYDIYGFFRYGIGIYILFLLFFFASAFGLSLLYRLENKVINKNE